MPNHRNRLAARPWNVSDLLRRPVFAGLRKTGAVDATTADGGYAVRLPAAASVVSSRGMVQASSLQAGDGLVCWGGTRILRDVRFETTHAEMVIITRGVLTPCQPVVLPRDQHLRIVDTRVAQMFGQRTAVVRVEDILGLEGVTSLGVQPALHAVLGLAVRDAIYLETLWLQALSGASAAADHALMLTAEEARLLLSAPLIPRSTG